MKKLILLIGFIAFGAVAKTEQTTMVIMQDFGVKAPAAKRGISECTSNTYANRDCYVASSGVLFVYNDELKPSAIKHTELSDGYYHFQSAEIINEFRN